MNLAHFVKVYSVYFFSLFLLAILFLSPSSVIQLAFCSSLYFLIIVCSSFVLLLFSFSWACHRSFKQSKAKNKIYKKDKRGSCRPNIVSHLLINTVLQWPWPWSNSVGHCSSSKCILLQPLVFRLQLVVTLHNKLYREADSLTDYKGLKLSQCHLSWFLYWFLDLFSVFFLSFFLSFLSHVFINCPILCLDAYRNGPKKGIFS